MRMRTSTTTKRTSKAASTRMKNTRKKPMRKAPGSIPKKLLQKRELFSKRKMLISRRKHLLMR